VLVAVVGWEAGQVQEGGFNRKGTGDVVVSMEKVKGELLLGRRIGNGKGMRLSIQMILGMGPSTEKRPEMELSMNVRMEKGKGKGMGMRQARGRNCFVEHSKLRLQLLQLEGYCL
jgi:hypothetical protein